MLGFVQDNIMDTEINMPAHHLQESEAENTEGVTPIRRPNKRRKGVDTRRQARLVQSSSNSSDDENVPLFRRSKVHHKPATLVDLNDTYKNEISRLKNFRLEDPLNQAFIKLLNQLNDLKPQDQATAKVPMQNLSAYCELLNQATPQDPEEATNLSTRRVQALSNFKISVETHMLGHGNQLVQTIAIALLAFSASILLVVAISPFLNLLTLSIAAAAVALPSAAVIPTTAAGIATGVVGAIGIFGSRSSEPYNSAKDFIEVAKQSINLP